jgi:hypothetical protein
MSDQPEHQMAASADIADERTSPQGTKFDSGALQDFLRSALRHDALRDEVNQVLYDHVEAEKLTAPEVTAKLRPLIGEALATATEKDWACITSDLLAEADDALHGAVA